MVEPIIMTTALAQTEALPRPVPLRSPERAGERSTAAPTSPVRRVRRIARRGISAAVLSAALAAAAVAGIALLDSAGLSDLIALGSIAAAWFVLGAALTTHPAEGPVRSALRPTLLTATGTLLVLAVGPDLGVPLPSTPALLVLLVALGAIGIFVALINRALHPVRTVVLGAGPSAPHAAAPLDGGTMPLLDDMAIDPADYAREVLVRVDETGAELVEVRGPLSTEALQHLSWELRTRGVPLSLQFLDTGARRSRIRVVQGPAGASVLVRPPQRSVATRIGKRLFDVIGSLALIAILSPAFVAVAAAIRIDDRGPILYRQERVGKDGRPFHMLKFRSMAVDADARLAQLLREQDSDDKPLFKIHDDPRLTRIGGFLRRYSLDELPQLLNVLGGSMSLVGPRPQRDGEVALYSGTAFHRLGVTPGMTGLWQVSGRSSLTWEQAQELDVDYAHNWSLPLDLWILMRTAKAVVGSEGAV